MDKSGLRKLRSMFKELSDQGVTLSRKELEEIAGTLLDENARPKEWWENLLDTAGDLIPQLAPIILSML
jgi:hypothetical protein